MNISESNKLIAEFMEFTKEVNSLYHVRMGTTVGINKIVPPAYMEFDTNWNWLMPVVEKIESLVFPNDIFYNFNILGGCQVYIISSALEELIDCSKGTKLLSVFEAVIEFIKWYNENNLKNNS